MTYRCYVEKKFNAERSELIRQSNIIIEEYQRKGLTMTLRQLYYQMVSRNVFANDDKNYDKLGSTISDARIAGLVSWTAIEDRTRFLRGRNFFDNPGQAFRQARENYMIDRWAGQEWRPEVWIEKDALIGVIENVCHELCVDYFSCRGYSSQSEQWRAGRRFAGYVAKGQRPIVFHLGDHDPDGIDMTRDNQARLSLFAGVQITVVRLALNRDQIDRYNPPPNPAKKTSARYEAYYNQTGTESSWELDALAPDVISNLIQSSVQRIRNAQLWEERLAEEAEDKDSMDIAIENLGGGTND
jgi:hypothetical protein